MIDVVADRHKLHSLKSEWNALADLQENPLLYFDWFMSCAETLHSGDELCIIVVREKDAVVAIAPLCVSSRHSVRSLELLGSALLYEPSGFLYTDRESLRQLVHAIVNFGTPLVLLRLPDDPLLQACITAVAWRNAIILRKPSAPSAFLKLPQDWQRFMESLSSSRSYDFRRKRKCLNKSGQVTTRILSPDLSEYATLLQEALRVEDKSWKGRQGSSLLKNSKLRFFFETYLHKACGDGLLRVCFIDVDGVPVSMHIAIECNHAFWVLKLGYDEALAKCSPGAQLAMDTIEYSVRQGLARYEFLGSEEPWQKAWPIEKHSYFTVLIYPYSLRGFLGLFGFVMMYAKKQLLRFFVKTQVRESFC